MICCLVALGLGIFFPDFIAIVIVSLNLERDAWNFFLLLFTCTEFIRLIRRDN